MIRAGPERLRKTAFVLRFRIVQINRPGDRGCSVIDGNFLFDIVLRHDIVAEESAAFAFSSARGDPGNLPLRPFRLPGEVILQEGPVHESGHQRVVPDVFDLLGLIAILPAFIFPVSCGDGIAGLFGEPDPPVDIGEGDRMILFGAGPEQGEPHDFIRRLLRAERFIEDLLPLAAIEIAGSRQMRNGSIAGTVGEKFSAEACLLSRDRVP